MNAPMWVVGAAMSAGTAAIVSAQESVSTADSWTPTGVGGLATIIAAAIVTVIGAWKMAKIEAHVNSKMTSLSEQLISKDRENALLREMLEDRKTATALLAQAESNRRQAPPLAAAPVLEQIETNTDATAKNTARTEATVTQLKKDQ